jgi:hypothetical protein
MANAKESTGSYWTPLLRRPQADGYGGLHSARHGCIVGHEN